MNHLTGIRMNELHIEDLRREAEAWRHAAELRRLSSHDQSPAPATPALAPGAIRQLVGRRLIQVGLWLTRSGDLPGRPMVGSSAG